MLGYDLAAGERVGRFSLLRPLGHGAMGEVWAARDPELDRDVALKLLRPRAGVLSNDASERLRGEARAMARLNHRNVVSIYELGADGTRVFCAMELIDGITLRAWLETARPWQEVIQVAIAVGRGLAAAHAAGVVHRDVKPENVLIAHDGRTLVTDFGLAKLADSLDDVHASRPEESRAFALGSIEESGSPDGTGTPAYVAPEQRQGRNVGAQSDQFGYCVMFYEALFGAAPAAGSAPPRPLDDKGVPSRLVRALQRGLAADPAARWPSMNALVAALARAIGGNRRWLVAGGALACGLAIATVVVVTSRSDETSGLDVRVAAETRVARAWNPARRAQLEAAFVATGAPAAAERAASAAATLDRYRADWLSQRLDAWAATHDRGVQSLTVLEQRIACFDRLADAMGELVSVLETPAPAEVGRAPDIVQRLEPVSACGNLRRLAAQSTAPSTLVGQELARGLRELEALLFVGRHAEALRRAETLLARAEQVGDPMLKARARFNLGALLAHAGRLDEAEAVLRGALQDAAEAKDHYLVATTWIRLFSLIAQEIGRPKVAAHLEPAVRAAVAQAGDDPRLQAELAFALGMAAYSRADFSVARDQFAAARDRHVAISGADSQNVANSESNLAAALIGLGELDEAARLLDHALVVSKATLGGSHPATSRIEINLAAIATERKDWSDAERHLRSALVVDLVVQGPDHPDLARTRTLLASALREQGRLAEARTELDQARASVEQSLPPTNVRRIYLDLDLAEQDAAEGQWRTAEALARKAVDALRANDAEVADLVDALTVHARVVAHRSPREALAIYDQTLTLQVSQESRDDADDRELLEELARAALAARRPKPALAWFARLPDAAFKLTELQGELERLGARR